VEATGRKKDWAKQEAEFAPRHARSSEAYPMRRREEREANNISTDEKSTHHARPGFKSAPPFLHRREAFLVRQMKQAANNRSKRRRNMATDDKCCSIVPYFKVASGKMGAFQKLCEQFVAKTKEEARCLYYGFCFDGDVAHCREGYEGADGLLAHLQNVGALLEEALKIAELVRLEIHGPEGELAKLREPLAHLKPQFFVLEYGFRR
jgi:quinol monooxygenase YgiN